MKLKTAIAHKTYISISKQHIPKYYNIKNQNREFLILNYLEKSPKQKSLIGGTQNLNKSK